ncbi:hypothetical protein SAMN05660657_03112 [Geodermatophilus amargosae]|jgi:hypothetical protein|uniref:Uncharacterized protein n=1 Tax=Geodermatophilus amargosae TaxID=1296565 RepID=A0A1I7AX11_9ACTN|nr:hypothetical protein [Geodermatophilus amargosae]SFT79507.1 hypothetical protein SAMN05660657_03112 [Geodermatophilus amargosae]
MSTATTPRRRWRLAAVGLALAAAPFTAACGSDVVDDDVQQNVEEGVEDAEEEVEDATDGEDSDG